MLIYFLNKNEKKQGLMTQKMGLMPSKNESSLLRPAINEWRPKKGKLRLTLNFNHLHYKSHTHPRNTKNWWLCAAASPIYTSSPIFSWGLLLPNER